MNKEQYQQYCIMQTNWWTAYASSGAAKNRKIYHGRNGSEFTDEEKIQDAFDTAQTHMRNYFNSCNGIEL